jgi:hypothetical protein
MLIASIALVLLNLNQKPPFDVRASDMGLLQHEAVQRELKLSPDQISHIDQAEKDYRSDTHRTRSWDSDEEHAAVAKYLSAPQLKRLREISMQTNGPIVLIVDFVAERIGAGPQRQKQIKRAFSSAINEAIQPMTKEIEKAVNEELKSAGNDPDEVEAKAEKASEHASKISESADHGSIERNAAKKILDTLTPTELKAWKDLQGAPFPVEQLKHNDKD